MTRNRSIPHPGKKIRVLLFTAGFVLLSGICAAQEEEPVAPPAAETEQEGTRIEVEPADNEINYLLEKRYAFPDSFRFRDLPDSTKNAYEKDPDFWYANHNFEEEISPASNREYKPVRQRQGMAGLMWGIMIIAFAGILIWYLVYNKTSLFDRKSLVIRGETEEGEETEDIFAIRYEAQIARATREGNYRLAVRFMFLRILRDLSKAGLIRYKQDRTNLDYLTQLYNTKMYRPFFRLARDYEYAWYGHFEISREAFGKLKEEFDQFNTAPQ